MKVLEIKYIFPLIYNEISINKDYLVELDQVFGDGDLGLSMEQGFLAVKEYTEDSSEVDFGKFFLQVSKTFNESAPSSLGTILSFLFMGMAKSLKGNEEITLDQLKDALNKGVLLIEEKAKSKLNEKTILDSIIPAVNAFNNSNNINDAIKQAHIAAKTGMENTKNIQAVHGRAAYHKEKTLGHIDGGAYVSYLIFKAIDNA